MTWYKELNGTVLRGLATFGALAIGVVVLIALEWLADEALGQPTTTQTVIEVMISISVLMFSGSAGYKYAQSHEIEKKDAS